MWINQERRAQKNDTKNELWYERNEKLKKFVEYSSNLFAFFYAHLASSQLQKLLNLNTLLCILEWNFMLRFLLLTLFFVSHLPFSCPTWIKKIQFFLSKKKENCCNRQTMDVIREKKERKFHSQSTQTSAKLRLELRAQVKLIKSRLKSLSTLTHTTRARGRVVDRLYHTNLITSPVPAKRKTKYRMSKCCMFFLLSHKTVYISFSQRL